MNREPLPSSTTERCPTCGAELGTRVRGYCPRCLLARGLESIAADADGETIGLDESAPRTDVRESDSAGAKVPSRVGNYEILGEIARGGMGVIYRARHDALDRVVALKMILESHLASEKIVQRFLTEAAAVAKLRHPNIVPIYEVGRHGRRHYFTMPFIDGEDLARYIRSRSLSARQAAEIVRGIARAVAFAHEKGVLHRDLKPANVLIDANGEPHVTDFGLAKQLADEESQITKTGEVLGTPSYMSPEQAGGERRLTTRTDIYSIGALLYELLTGRPPFRADSLAETLRQVREEDPPKPRMLHRALPRDLETICLKCLQKKPAARYASAAELAEDLDRFLTDRSILARPVPAAMRLLRHIRRHPWRLVSTIVVLTVIAAAAAIAFDARTERLVFEERLRVELDHHAFIARSVADQLALELHALGEMLLRVSRSPGLASDLRRLGCERANREERSALFERLETARSESPPGIRLRFENWNLIDASGHTVARSPDSAEYRAKLDCRDVSDRDYFRAAAPRSSHLSLPFRSSVDEGPRFALSVGIADENGIAGVLAGLVTLTSTADLSGSESRHRVLVLAPDDASSELLVIGDPEYRGGSSVKTLHPGDLPFRAAVDAARPLMPNRGPQSRALGATDRFASLDGGRWIAGFAQIGNTAFTVVVQSRFDDIFPRGER